MATQVSTSAIPAITIHIRDFNGVPTECVNARELHSAMQVGRKFAGWITNRITQYRFEEGEDYVLDLCYPERGSKTASHDESLITPNGVTKNDGGSLVSQNGEIKKDPDDLIRQNGRIKNKGGDRRSIDYFVTLDMAKELAMLERTELGQQARRFFIAAEKAGRADRAELEQLRGQLLELKGSTAPLSDKQAKSLRGVIGRQAMPLPPTQRDALFKKHFGSLNAKFGVNTYRDIPQRRYFEAKAWLLEYQLANQPEPTPDTPALPAPIEPNAPLTDLQVAQLKTMASAISQRQPPAMQNRTQMGLYRKLRRLEGVHSYQQLSQRYFADAVALLQKEGAGPLPDAGPAQPATPATPEPAPVETAPVPEPKPAPVELNYPPAELEQQIRANLHQATLSTCALKQLCDKNPAEEVVALLWLAESQQQTASNLLESVCG